MSASKCARLAIFGIATAAFTSQAHAQWPGPQNVERAAIQEPGVYVFYQSLGVGRSGYQPAAESYAATGAVSSTASKSVRRSAHGAPPYLGAAEG
jgi:hypothetical protein